MDSTRFSSPASVGGSPRSSIAPQLPIVISNPSVLPSVDGPEEQPEARFRNQFEARGNDDAIALLPSERSQSRNSFVPFMDENHQRHGSALPEDDAPMDGPDVHPVVVMPAGMPLRSAVTYSNVPGGYANVAQARVNEPFMRGPERVLVPKYWVRMLDNPESIALLVVSRSNEGAFRPSLAVTHQKLRYLFKDAVKWYLKQQGVDESDIQGTFVKVNGREDGNARVPGARLSMMRVNGDGYDFYAPTPEVITSSTATSIVALAVFFGIIAFALYLAMLKLFGGYPAVAIAPPAQSTCPIRSAMNGVAEFQQNAKGIALRALGRGILYFDGVVAQARGYADL
ncbi:hypothetical protein GY45DRAFT_1376300 [Cubamyces sp. BRFM 1775]|nr:hypothetical protein GY45DRAFT_1376300 [Cubamyces sp. BRFM 1775]